VQDTISEWPVAANVVPWWLSRSVIGTVGLVGRRVRAKRRFSATKGRFGQRGSGAQTLPVLLVRFVGGPLAWGHERAFGGLLD